jgi:hypothetical protein
MDRRKSRRIESKAIQWTKGKVVELKRLFLLSIVLPCFQFYDFFFCPLYCLAFNSTTFPFVHCIALLSKGNTMDKRKSRRIESKAIQWTKGKVVELKARQYNGQKEKS